MSVTLSVATSADGYIDDCSDKRLILSTPEDWAEVYALRANADAIVIGAETLRCDNPRLTLKSDELRKARIEAGRHAEPYKVIISRSGAIDPSLRIFQEPDNKIIIFSQVEREELKSLAEVVVKSEITAEFIRKTLEQRGISKIFVEGGAQILSMFLAAGCADTLRIACNPSILVGDGNAPKFDKSLWIKHLTPTKNNLGGMEIELYTLNDHLKNHDAEFDHDMLQRAIEISRNCIPSATSYCVGAVVVTSKGELFEGYTHETSPTHHAEQEAIKKAEEAGADLHSATIYSSMEPCSQRSSEPESCSEIIIRHHFARVIFALYEPNCFVNCKGAENMRNAGIKVETIDSLAESVREVNSHLF